MQYEFDETIPVGTLASAGDLLACVGHRVCFDWETTGLYWWSDAPIGLGFLDMDTGKHGYIPTADYHPNVREKRTDKPDLGTTVDDPMGYSGAVWAVPNETYTAEVKQALAAVLTAPGTHIYGHNLKFDMHFADVLMWDHPKVRYLDTTVMLHLVDSRLRKSLAEAEKKFLGRSSKRSTSAAAKASLPKSRKNQFYRYPLLPLAEYCVNDVLVTVQLAQVLEPGLSALKLDKLFTKDMRYLAALQRIERDGHMIDVEFIRGADDVFARNLAAMEEELYDAIGYKFNWRSSKQLSKAIYQDLGIEFPVNPYADEDGVDRSKFADRGMYNGTMTSTFILREKVNHPLAALISDLRETTVMRNNTKKWALLRDQGDIIHANFKLTGTRTGRLSCGDPNMQNIPSAHRVRETQSAYSGGSIRSEEYNLRQGFIARPGHKLVKLDHKQQEMRLFGVLSQDPNMLPVLTSGADIHLGVALAVWGDQGDETNSLHREWAKTIGFGLIYGMTTGSLQHRLNKTADEANKIAEQYWTRFPRIRPWLFEVMATMEKQGFVRYWSGRIWREEQPDMFYRGANAQIQGGAADLMSIAVMRCMRILDAQGWGRVVNLVHDEIVFEILEEHLATAIPVLARVMEVEDLFGLPFVADANVGDNFGLYEEYPLERDFVRSIDWEKYAETANG